MYENFESNVQVVGSSDGVYFNDISVSGSDGDIISAESDGSTGTVSDVSGSDSSTGSSASVSSGNADINYPGTDSAYQEIVSKGFETLQKEVSILNGTVLLIFILLICAWTEKKINGWVERFTQRKER